MRKLKWKSFFACCLCVLMALAASYIPVNALENSEQETEESYIGVAEELQDDNSEQLYGENENSIIVDDYDDAVFPAGYATQEDAYGIADNKVYANSSGSFGTGLSWSLSNGELTISGSGAIEDFTTYDQIPWNDVSSQITSVNVKSGITGIGDYAFVECYNLKSVTLASSVQELGYAAFGGCTSLTTFSATGLKTIGDYAFQDTKIDTFTVPASLTEISNIAFLKAYINNFAVASGNTVYSAKDGVLYADKGTTIFRYPIGRTATSFTIPSEVTTIGDYAFMDEWDLTEIVLPNTLKKMGKGAFSRSGLTSVKIPDSVTEADYFTFEGCSNLKEVTFGTGLTSTAYHMFYECSELKTINFGSALQSLDALTFAYCNSLKSIDLPANIKEIGSGCFGGCTALESFTSRGLEIIPFQSMAFCSNLKNVQLNEGVTRISRVSFNGCDNLKNITLPASVTYVDENAFPKTTVITCKNPEMRKFGYNGYRYLDDISFTGTERYDYAYQVLDIVNQERKSNGLSALYMDASLMNSAMVRAAENVALFSHTRPDGSICFSINSLMTAENIAVGQTSPQNVMDSWMNSEGHRENILSGDSTSIGIGCFEYDGSLYWVQCFGQNSISSNASQPSNSQRTRTVSLATEVFNEATTSTGIIWGELQEYKYNFAARVLNQSSTDITLNNGETAQVYLTLVNPGTKWSVKVDGNITWNSSNTNAVTISGTTVSAIANGTADITAKTKYYTSAPVRVTVGSQASGGSGGSQSYSINPEGIYVASVDGNGILMGMVTSGADTSNIEYRWVACNENDCQWFTIQDWTRGNEWLAWKPSTCGNYIFVCYARIAGTASAVEASVGVNYHLIKGVCQMPYTGEGGGYLIGLETYDNPNQSYRYEMLILDCTLYAQGLPAWIYSTGQCQVPENCLWTIWQPQYGYYWTLFRIYDENGNLLDEICYGFENIC